MAGDPRERLQKVLAHRGVGSRRTVEGWIQAGRVRVNGMVADQLGTKVDPDRDRIEVDGVEVPAAPPPIVVLLNKPPGYVTTVRDPHAQRTVMELVAGLERRVYPVGRLDRDSRGVLLLTDDGELAHQLLHPSRGVPKVYRVVAAGLLDDALLERLATGVELEDGPTAPARVWGVERGAGRTSFSLELREGRKRQIRRMVRAVESRVVDLRRVSFGGVRADGLPEGMWRILSAAEVELLRGGLGAKDRRRDAPRAADGARAGGKGGDGERSPGPKAGTRRAAARNRRR